MDKSKLSYKQAGVDIDAGERLVENIKPLAAKTKRTGLMGGIGGFGALFEIPNKFKSPVLVSGTDGVGTKLKIAAELNKHDTIGIDLVAMSVNDIIVQGAEPLFFLDYFSCGHLDVGQATEVMKGIAKGCELAGCALIGGETAEMPGMYTGNEYDLAGFAVGAVEKNKLISGLTVKPGDVLLGLGSNGAHSNGYSLIRDIIRKTSANLNDKLDERTLGEHLIQPTRIYVPGILKTIETGSIKGIAHITGGGLIENLPRTLPKTLSAEVRNGSWPRGTLFDWIKRTGDINEIEMLRVFNCGIGMVIVISPEDVESVTASLTQSGEKVYMIGNIVNRKGDEHQTRLI